MVYQLYEQKRLVWLGLVLLIINVSLGLTSPWIIKVMMDQAIRENLLYVAPLATEQELEQVLQIAQLHLWIQTLPNGLDTKIGFLY